MRSVKFLIAAGAASLLSSVAFAADMPIAPPPMAYAPPPVVYYQPQPVYVAPPPEVYAPPPVYYSPPGLSLGINIPLR